MNVVCLKRIVLGKRLYLLDLGLECIQAQTMCVSLRGFVKRYPVWNLNYSVLLNVL